MTTDATTKREKLLKRLEQTKNDIKKLDARERAKKRKIDNRTKIIVGGTVLAHMEHDANFKKEINRLINNYGRKQDKEYLKRHKFSTDFNLVAVKADRKSVSPTPNKGKLTL